MSDPDFGFAPPPFKPDEALAQMRRALRDLKLTERGNGFDLRGKRVLEIEHDAGAAEIRVRVARKLALTPQWDVLAVRSTSEQRRALDEVKKRLARWESDE